MSCAATAMSGDTYGSSYHYHVFRVIRNGKQALHCHGGNATQLQLHYLSCRTSYACACQATSCCRSCMPACLTHVLLAVADNLIKSHGPFTRWLSIWTGQCSKTVVHLRQTLPCIPCSQCPACPLAPATRHPCPSPRGTPPLPQRGCPTPDTPPP